MASIVLKAHSHHIRGVAMSRAVLTLSASLMLGLLDGCARVADGETNGSYPHQSTYPSPDYVYGGPPPTNPCASYDPPGWCYAPRARYGPYPARDYYPGHYYDRGSG